MRATWADTPTATADDGEEPTVRRRRPTDMRNAGWLAILGAPAVVAAVLAGVLAGCGTARAGQQPAPATRVMAAAPGPARGTPQQRAAADAAHTLAAFVPPPHAVRTGRLPVSWLAQPPSEPLSPDLVIQSAWWRVAGQPAAVLAWLQAHRPAGFSDGGTGALGVIPPGSGRASSAAPPPVSARMRYIQFTLPDVPGVLLNRVLSVAVAADGPGQTAIRVDAEAVWVQAKPAAELIPASARVVTITPVAGDMPPAAADHQVTVTDRVLVARIGAVVDALPVYPRFDWIECGPGPGTGMQLTFRATAGGPALAVVTAYQELCPLVHVTVRGEKMPVLDGAGTLFQRVMAIAGFRWPDFPVPGSTGAAHSS